MLSEQAASLVNKVPVDHVADTPTIIFSSNLPTKEVEKRHITGFSKPFELDELLSTIERKRQD